MKIIAKCIVVLVLCVAGSMQYCLFKSNPDQIWPDLRNFSNITDITPDNYTMPENLKGTCPDFDYAPRCCDLSTMQTLFVKLKQIDGVFGDSGTGCSICGANVKRFWCMYNCAANQHEFIDPKSAAIIDYIVDPTDPTSNVTITTANITLDIPTVCSIYESCKSVDFTKALASMKSYQGLFNTFASQAIPDGMLMNFSYTANGKGLISAVNNCSMIFNSTKDQYGYYLGPQGWCNCQHCAYNCSSKIDFSQYIEQHGMLDGLKTSILGRAALVAGILLAIGLFLRFFGPGKSKSESTEGEIDERSHSVQAGGYQTAD